jgi:hypothetical protein
MPPKRAVVGIITLNEAELMCRMIEAATGEPRPSDMTAMQAVTQMIDGPTREMFLPATRAALLYLLEQTEAAVVVTTDRANRQAVIGDEVFPLH